MKFEGEWRFTSPGPVSLDVQRALWTLIGRITSQGERKSVLELFKRGYAEAAGATHAPSSNESWAETDLDKLMEQVADNEALFIAGFHTGWQLVRDAWPAFDLPGEATINQALEAGGSAFRIDGNTLVSIQEDSTINVVTPGAILGPVRDVNPDDHAASDVNEDQGLSSIATEEDSSGPGAATSQPAVTLQEMAIHGDTEVRRLAAANSNVPAELLERLAGDSERTVRIALAMNPATPPEILSRLATDTDDELRIAAAIRESTPVESLMLLSKDMYTAVRRAVGGNKSTPPPVLDALALDLEAQVRKEVARNPATPLDVLGRLSRDPDARVREAVAENREVPPSEFEPTAAEGKAPRIARSTPRAVVEQIVIRTVEHRVVRQNLTRHGPDLVSLADGLLARLDRALAPDPMRHHNQPPELLEDPVEHAVLEGLRADLRRFRDALATAITDPAKRVESVVHDGSRLVGALKAVADHPIVQRPALGAAAVGISALALSAGVPVDPMITLGLMVVGPEGAKAVRGALGRLGGGGR